MTSSATAYSKKSYVSKAEIEGLIVKITAWHYIYSNFVNGTENNSYMTLTSVTKFSDWSSVTNSAIGTLHLATASYMDELCWESPNIGRTGGMYRKGKGIARIRQSVSDRN